MALFMMHISSQVYSWSLKCLLVVYAANIIKPDGCSRLLSNVIMVCDVASQKPVTFIFTSVRPSIMTYEGWLISNAHSEIFCQWSKVAMRAHCVLVATTLLQSGAKFHSFLYTGSKTVRVNMESCYGGMSTRLQQHAVTEEGAQFLFNIVTGDESWIHHFDPEEKWLSMQYRHTSAPPPKKIKTMPSAGKILLTVFWDSQRVYVTELLEAGNTVNSARYIETIKKPTAEGVSS